MIKNCSLKKCISKLLFLKISPILLPRKYISKTFQNCSLKKCIPKTHVELLPKRMHFKIEYWKYNQNPVDLKH